MKNEEATSPVIGAILMIVLTVLVSAIIGSFVIGYTTTIDKLYEVGATAHYKNNGGTGYLSVTYIGGPSQDMVSSVYARVWNTSGVEIGNMNLSNVVGNTSMISNVSKNNNHVVVNATFYDGKAMVILDTWV